MNKSCHFLYIYDDFTIYRARGIDTATARNMLVYSFGGEIVKELEDKKLVQRVEAAVKHSLDKTLKEM